MSGRIYNSIIEAVDEVQRELFEMGIKTNSYSYQDKVVNGHPDFVTTELLAYSFTIVKPKISEVFEAVEKWYGPTVRKWLMAEFRERVGNEPVNPGEAWEIRAEVWTKFLEKSGKFAYTYSERIYPQLDAVISELKAHQSTRQAVVELHNNTMDLENMGGIRRIPCSMFYQFMIRKGAMNCIYVMRSSDFLTHFVNDIGLAILLQDYVREQVGMPEMGEFHMFVSSLHAFYGDMAKKGIF